MGLMNAARTRVGAAVIGGTLLALGGGVAATAAVMDNAPAEPVSDVAPTSTATPTEAPEPVVAPAPVVADAPAPVEAPEPAPQAASVDTVTEPEAPQQQAAEPAPIGDQSGDSYDPLAPYVDSAGTTYVPAPDLPVEPMPGEPGWVPPTR